jgi:phage/plasmid-associated DNA primase
MNTSFPHGWDLGDEAPAGVDLEALLAGAKTSTAEDQEEALVELEERLAADAELDEGVEPGNGDEDNGENDNDARHSVGGNRNYELSDTGNAERFVDSYGEDLRYVPEWKKWIVWKDEQWRVNNDGAAKRRAIDCTNDMLDEARQTKNAAIRAWAGKKNHARINAMVDLAQVDLRMVLHVEKIDANPMMLGVQNGVVDLQKHVFRPARREDYITKRCNVRFDKDAKCPNWLKFLNLILPATGMMVSYTQRLSGYILTGLVSPASPPPHNSPSITTSSIGD